MRKGIKDEMNKDLNETSKASNYVHYKDELINILTAADMGFGEEEPLTMIGYKRCYFIKDHIKDFCNDNPTRCDTEKCRDKFREWLNEEYKDDE